MKSLSTKQCIKLLKKYDTTRRIFLHSRKVNAIARFLTVQANKNGFNLNSKLIDNASLLHDIEKFHSLNDSTIDHATEGEKTLTKEGFPEIGKIIGSHTFKSIINPANITIQDKIICYADMRVNEDKIVSSKERYEYSKERYGSCSPEKMKFFIRSEDKCFKFENDLLKQLKLNPEAITETAVKKYLIEDKY
jgi:putative nucleotidyltransferase with HDIG domain